MKKQEITSFTRNLLSSYRNVASINVCLQFGNQLCAKRSQYISIENPLYKQSEKACMCFKMRQASTRDYTVVALGRCISKLYAEGSTHALPRFWVTLHCESPER